MLSIKRALLSVSDKTGIVEFAQFLVQQHVELISTGGTAKLLFENDIPVTEISEYTGFPEMLDGRVKTLHPKVHAGLLARGDHDSEVLDAHGISNIDLVIVNLYPFVQTIAKKNCSLSDAIENIDIGGPTMLRAAAKNYKYTAVVCDPADYTQIQTQMSENDYRIDEKTRFELAVKTFNHTAQYDGMISQYLTRQDKQHKPTLFPSCFNLQVDKVADMRYGENPHQKAALYQDTSIKGPSVMTATQHQGKPLSFNNVADADAALTCTLSFEQTACTIVKHANPCGVATDDSALKAYQKAFACDPASAFGGIIAFNCNIDEVVIDQILENQFFEVIIAQSYTDAALKRLETKKNVRVLSIPHMNEPQPQSYDFKRIQGGLLIQETDLKTITLDNLEVVTDKKPTKKELQDLLFAWYVVKQVKSNAIVYAKNNQTLGIGAGQMSRVFSAKIGLEKAQEANLNTQNCVMASDAFFPFRDSIDTAAKEGVRAIIQPGGSIRDDEVIAAANEHGIIMVLTHCRHFKH